MALEVAMEDDLFFADLDRQISLLIDEDEGQDDFPLTRFPSFAAQGYSSRMIHHPPIIQSSQYLYEENGRREMMCKGTGVFIPQSSQPIRRKYKQGKRSAQQSYATKSNNNKQLTSSRGRPITNANSHNTKLSNGYDNNAMINRY